MTLRLAKRKGWPFHPPKPPLRPQGALRQALRPLARRMRWLRALRWTTLGVLVACVACLLWMGASFLIPLASLAFWVAITAAALPVAAFAVGILAPLPWRGVVYGADERGLAQRVETLLEQTQPNAMTRLLERDTLARLASFSPKQAFRPARMSKVWIASGVTALLALALVFVPNPQDAVLEERARMRELIAKQAEALETRMESVEDHLLSEVERVELRRELSELAQTLRNAQDAREALSALDQAQKRTETLLNRALARTLADQMSSVSSDAIDTLSQALEQNLGEQQGQALAERLSEAASEGDLSEAIESLAEALEESDAAEALAEALQQASNQASAPSGEAQSGSAQTGSASAAEDSSASANASKQALASLSACAQAGRTVRANVTALMQLARSGISQSGSSAAAGSSQSGGSGQGSQGSGSGQGSGRSSGQGSGQGGGVGGSSALSDRLGAFESVYDPTRLGGDAPISQVEGTKNEGDSTQVELGPGQGDVSGQVPYREVVGQYQAEAAQAMERENLPATLKEWVNRYFNALVD